MCYFPGAAKASAEYTEWMVSVLKPFGLRDPAKFRLALAKLGYVRDAEAAKAYTDAHDQY